LIFYKPIIKNQEKARILGIETSCDETGLAILDLVGSFPSGKISIVSNLISSQISIHRPWGGVVPNLARREHNKNLIPLLSRSFRESKISHFHWRWRLSQSEKKIIKETLIREKILANKLKLFLHCWAKPNLDFIAVTIGPGLEPALWTGANLALALSKIWHIPLIEVDHLEAHIAANWLTQDYPKEWPAIALIVSGGHTELVLMEKLGSYKIIGQTRDDAAGECFDKTARVLGLGYPGGPAISKMARLWTEFDQTGVPQEIKDITLPRPMIQKNNYDFSFSGLKTAVLYRHRSYSEKIKKHPAYFYKMAFEIENAINDVLILKTIRAAESYCAKAIMLGGGVSANQSLRDRLAKESKKISLPFFVPPIHFCTDNAAIIALAGLIHLKKAALSDTIKVKANLNLDHG